MRLQNTLSGAARPALLSSNTKERSCWDVNFRIDDREKLSLEAIGRFVMASEDIRFEAEDRQ
jgi:hypothetical protein